MIEALGLTMRFGRRTVVEPLSFRVGRGELCAFLGRNGAGKTTTMRLLARVSTSAQRCAAGTHAVVRPPIVRCSIGSPRAVVASRCLPQRR